MRTLTDWKHFDTMAEARALSDYTVLKWDGITAEEARVLALHAFHRGWHAVGDYFESMTVKGFPVSALDLHALRNKKLQDLGYEQRDIIFDKVSNLYMSLAFAATSLPKPPDSASMIKPLHSEALDKLGHHLSKARLKGWKSFRGTEGPEVSQKDCDLFQGISVEGTHGPDFITWTSLQYLKTGVSKYGDDAFKVLVSAMYSHGVKSRSLVNGEALGEALLSIDVNQKIALANAKVDVASVPIATRLLAGNKDINWVALPDYAQSFNLG